MVHTHYLWFETKKRQEIIRKARKIRHDIEERFDGGVG